MMLAALFWAVSAVVLAARQTVSVAWDARGTSRLTEAASFDLAEGVERGC